jgi:hypothetical protein
MNHPMSRTAAIREARRLVTLSAHGRQYVIYSPYKWSEPAGPNTHSLPYDWERARQTCTRMRAEMALYLMGIYASGDAIEQAADRMQAIERAIDAGCVALQSIVAHVAQHRC